MSIEGWQVRLGIFLGVGALVCVNALGIWSAETSVWVLAALQMSAVLAVVVCGAVVAPRVIGIARLWRLFVVAGFSCWLIGVVFWWTGLAKAGGAASWLSVAAWFLPSLLIFAGMLLMLNFGGVSTGRGRDPLRGPRVITVLDGLVAATSFIILVVVARFGAMTGVVFPRPGKTAVELVWLAIELVVVVTAMLTAMVFRPDRLDRANYLLLVGGVVLLASGDRTIAYFQTVGIQQGELWCGLGFVLGPLCIAYSLLEFAPSAEPEQRSQNVMDWVQLGLPFIGFLGNAILFAFHVLIGQRLSALLTGLAVMMVMFVAARQLIALQAQRQLTRRLLDTQSRLAHQVHHDSLTGLPNRVLFAQRLDEALRDGPFVLIFVDLDDFKEVNDRFGHAAGDELLCAVGLRLQTCVGAADTLARIGGDEFAILITGELEPPEVVGDRIRVALRDPFALNGSSVRVRASMGLVRPGADDLPPTSDDLLRQADVSMYAGKRVGKNTAVVFGPSLGVSTDFPTALRKADGGIPPGFTLAYQPIVQLPDGKPVAVEALARWTAPNGTQIHPEAFVAAAEAAGLGAAVDIMVLDLALTEMEASGLNLVLHVNVGAGRLSSPDFGEQVQQTLARHALAPSQLVLEITETVPILDLGYAATQINRLNELGIQVALDDFGAGYNSLTYLHVMPVQIIKLDRSLAVGAQPDRSVTLYRSVTRLCGALGLGVIAEGIESPPQAGTVFAAGCRLAQGHLFGRAVPIAELSLSSALSLP